MSHHPPTRRATIATIAPTLSTWGHPSRPAGARYKSIRPTVGTTNSRYTVEALAHGQPVQVPVRAALPDDSLYRGPVLVTARRGAILTLSWVSMWCTKPIATDAVSITDKPKNEQISSAWKTFRSSYGWTALAKEAFKLWRLVS